MNRQLFQYHQNFGYTFIPGLKARIEHEGGGYLVQVNRDGFRSSREFNDSKDPNTFRILLFGDSFTAGDGVSNRQRYSDLLEGIMPGVEVYNFSISGTGTDQQYIIFKEYAEKIEHDVVVLGLLVENIRRVAAHYRVYEVGEGKTEIFAKPYFTLGSSAELIRGHFPVPKEKISEEKLSRSELAMVDRGGDWAWLRKSVNSLGAPVKSLVQRITGYQPLPAYDDASNPDWLLMKRILEQWAGESKKPFIVFLLPLYQYVEGTASAAGYQERFREFAGYEGITIHDALPDFAMLSDAEKREMRFQKDIHPTPKCHSVLANSVKNALAPFLECQAREVACR